ncbi:HAD family phosphatase [Oceanicola sp. D3]|uniref:HAD family hydrolase n=1 Tax=Oceanicola sp. D3 TaxID=2587163 RepID=UPI001123C911|nr:HAD family phosphatase [Oceanicola sp. D3]QDC11113.1 HAD family phosphatase [Oceanicola sp. D3]
MPVSAVIFDIGNVLIEWNPERFYDAEIGQERRERLFSEVDLHGMNDRVDRGETFRDMVMECAGANPDWHDEITLWHDRWIEMAQPAIDHSVRLLRALRAGGVPVFALSNFGIQSFELGESHYPFLAEFDRRYISGHMGVAKPDPEIYAMVEEDCGVAPEALLFADDRDDNIAMAKSRGWQTHLFEHPAGFANRLVAEGLLTEDSAR